MRLPKSTGIVRVAPPLVVCLLGLGFFFYLLYPHQLTRPMTGLAIPSGVVSGRPIHGDAPGGGHALAVGHLSVSVEETEPGSRSPINAGYLTALILTVFGAVLGLLYGGRMWSRRTGFLLAERRLPAVTGSPPRETTPALLSVFTL